MYTDQVYWSLSFSHPKAITFSYFILYHNDCNNYDSVLVEFSPKVST